MITKQSIKGSAYIYAGALIGFVSAGILMPRIFSTEEVGLVNLLVALTLLFSQFSNLGIQNVNTRIFPFFRNEEKSHNGIMMLGIIIVFSGILISFIAYLFLKGYLKSHSFDDSGMLSEHIVYLPILIFFTAFFSFFDSYVKALFDAVTGIFLKDFFVKLLNLVLIIFFLYKIIDFEQFVFLYVLAYISPVFFIIIVLKKRRQLFFKLPDKHLLKKHKREIIRVAFFGIVSGFSGIAIINVDKAMTTYFVGLDAMGIYAVCFYFGVLVSIPARPLRKISSIILAEKWKENNVKEILTVYRKSITNLLLIGTLLYVGLLVNLDNIFKILPGYEAGRYVIVFIGGAYLIEMFSGTSAAIINSSKYYRFYSFVMMLTIVLVIVSNSILIPLFNITGAALASFVTIAVASFIRFAFLLKKYRLQPYFYKHFIILGIGAGVLLVNSFIPTIENYILDIFVRSFIVGFIFITVSYLTNVSEDARQLLNKRFQNSFGRKNK